MNKNILIIYHGKKCNDGFTAAWVTYNALMKRNHEPFITLYPMNYGAKEIVLLNVHLNDMHNDGINYDEIFIVDFSLPIARLKPICIMFPEVRITILDHHKTTFEMYGYDMEVFKDYSCLDKKLLDGKLQVLLKNNRSGAGLCWEYFSPNSPTPDLVVYVQDRDLWRFDFFHTRAVHMYLMGQEKTIKNWDKIDKMLSHNWRAREGTKEDIIKEGEKLLEEYNEKIEELVAIAIPCKIESLEGLAVECAGEYSSEVGNRLALASGTYGMTYYYDKEANMTMFSLRSIGEYDVEVIAKEQGGGGHKNAAGFSLAGNDNILRGTRIQR